MAIVDPIGDAAASESWVQPLDRSGRLIALSVAVGVAIVIGLSLYLKPDARGHGTHEQLGLTPCLAMQVFHTPCPFCGMTTSFAHFAHGDPVASASNQPAGAVLFVVSVLVGIASVAGAVTGKWVPALSSDRAVKRGMLVLAVVVSLGWAYKIVLEWS